VAAPNPTLILVGGFLGSGKTTLLLRAAARLADRGLRAAIITNDQGGELVDTRLVNASGYAAEEIAGGCFCCRFSDFMAATERLRSLHPDVIFAEPVGSCMDISATILQPVKQLFGNRFRLAPFTVLVDPERARQLLHPEADVHLSYLFRNQLEEADLVCFTKTDLYSELPELPGVIAHGLSARTGEGVNEWLD
jgi:G3E family GTPase